MTRLGPLIRALHCCHSQTMNNALAAVDLTSSQGHIMGYLATHKVPPCPKDLEEEFHQTHATVSGLLSRLERKEFIELRPDENDRRCKRIYIQPKGWQCNKDMYQIILSSEERMMQGFTEEEKLQFESYLKRAIDNMKKEEPNP